MASPKVRTMIQTSTVPMHINSRRHRGKRNFHSYILGYQAGALVLTELIIVIIIIALMAGMVSISFPAILSRKQFESQAKAFISIMKMAQNTAAESDKKYAVNLDFEEQTYTLRQYTKADWEVILDEEPVMFEGYFSEQCYLDYVIFDDGTDTREPLEGRIMVGAWFYAARTGFQNGGNIVLLDSEGNPYSVIVNRLSKVISLLPGEDYEIPIPRETYELPF